MALKTITLDGVTFVMQDANNLKADIILEDAQRAISDGQGDVEAGVRLRFIQCLSVTHNITGESALTAFWRSESTQARDYKVMWENALESLTTADFLLWKSAFDATRATNEIGAPDGVNGTLAEAKARGDDFLDGGQTGDVITPSASKVLQSPLRG